MAVSLLSSHQHTIVSSRIFWKLAIVHCLDFELSNRLVPNTLVCLSIWNGSELYNYLNTPAPIGSDQDFIDYESKYHRAVLFSHIYAAIRWLGLVPTPDNLRHYPLTLWILIQFLRVTRYTSNIPKPKLLAWDLFLHQMRKPHALSEK